MAQRFYLPTKPATKPATKLANRDYICSGLIAGLMSFLQLSCGPPPEQVAAEVITALATKTQSLTFSSGISQTVPTVPSVTFPGQIACNANVYSFSSGGTHTIFVSALSGT